MKISIITPSFNSGHAIELAIKSVLNQDYADFEHIIVDGGSTDNTLGILKKYDHLKWTSEPDRGQVHAMNKGFSVSSGDIIGYLNADDYYLENAFSSVLPFFINGEKIIMGRVRVCSEKTDGIKEWICDPKTDFSSVLRHWEPNAFCVNPVGYFYLREVQEQIPLREETGSKHDLEFLIETALHFSITKIDKILGVFNHAQDTQTAREQLLPSYWQPKNFPFVDRLAKNLSDTKLRQFLLDRERGYQLRRHWTVKDAFSKGMAKELFDSDEVFMLPEDENECSTSKCGFVEHDRIGTKKDLVIPVLSMGKCGTKSIHQSLRSVDKNILPAQIYHTHLMDKNTIYKNLPSCIPRLAHPSVGLSINYLFNNYKDFFCWKFISGVREPISRALSGIYTVWPDISAENAKYKIQKFVDIFNNYFDIHFKSVVGIDVLKYQFDKNRGYTIINKDNISCFVYRLEDLSNIFTDGMHDFIGIPNLPLKTVNVGDNDHRKKEYKKAKATIRFDKTYLESVYSSNVVRHFYNQNEIDLFIRKWKKTTKNYVGPNKIYKPNKENERSIQKNSYHLAQYFCIKSCKIAYLSIPKNACTSIKVALARIKNPNILDLLQDNLSDIHNNPKQYFDLVTREINHQDNEFFMFTFTRNPYSRFLSFYRNKIYHYWEPRMDQYMRNKGFFPKMTMDKCLDVISSLPVHEMNEHFVPQKYFIFHKSKLNVDYIGKIEDMHSGLITIEKAIKQKLDVPSLNITSGRDDVKLSQSVKLKIQNIYSDDFDLFDYER